ncbi:MAG: hypothetical protein MK135_06210 [Polyangiaceae bacterium]|nr:hypothetical protein [Polyangiaceae bacterium]
MIWLSLFRTPRSFFLSTSLILVLGSSLVGCGSSAKEAATAAQETASAKKSSQPALPPLEEAVEPPRIVLKARVRNPRTLAEDIGATLGLPLRFEQLVSKAAGTKQKDLLPFWEDDVAVEVVAALPTAVGAPPLIIWSAGIRDKSGFLETLAAQGIEVMDGPENNQHFAPGESFCALGRSLGASAERVACANTEEALGQLLPYALRGLPAEELDGAAMAADISLAPAKETYEQYFGMARQWAIIGAQRLYVGQELFDSAVSEVATSLAQELVDYIHDLDGIAFRLHSSGTEYRAVAVAEHKSTSSWLAQAASYSAQHDTSLPAGLGELPQSAETVMYGHSLPQERFAKFFRLAADLLEGWALHQKFSPASAARLRKLTASLQVLLSDSILAEGAEKSPEDASTDEYWRLSASEVPLKSQYEFWNTLMDVLGDAELKKYLNSLSEEQKLADLLPKMTSQELTLQDGEKITIFRYENSAALETLLHPGLAEVPIISEAVDLNSIEEKTTASTPPRTYYLGLRQIGQRSWTALASQPEIVSELLSQAPAKGADAFSADGRLAILQENQGAFGGLNSSRALTDALGRRLEGQKREKAAALSKSLPFPEAAPLTWWVKATEVETPQVHLAMNLPKDFLRNFGTLLILASEDSSEEQK